MQAITHIPRRILIGFVKLYQLVLSPHMGAACRFTPTCSEYAVQALQKYGAFRGTILSIHRVLRCNPWGGHGYDPPVWYTERGSAGLSDEHPAGDAPAGGDESNQRGDTGSHT